MMQSVSYDVDPETGLLDYADLAQQVKREKPLILIAGYSAYPRLIDFAKMREIADDILSKCLIYDIKQRGSVSAELKVLDSFFEVAKAQNWVKPEELLKRPQRKMR